MAKKLRITHPKGHDHDGVHYPHGSIIDSLEDFAWGWIVDNGVGELIDVVEAVIEDEPAKPSRRKSVAEALGAEIVDQMVP